MKKLCESETVELKQMVTEDLKKEVVAFANTNGGDIYIGAADDGSIIGLENSDKEKTRVTNMVRDTIKPDITLFVETAVIPEDNKELLQIKISRGTNRPYYISKKGLRPEGVFVRQGNSSVPATIEHIRRLIKETDGDSFEELRSLNQDLTFNEAAHYFAANKLEFGPSQMKTLHILGDDNLYTNLALILSDQNPFTVKAAVFQGTDQSLFKDRREFSGSLLKQLEEILNFLNLLNPLQGSFADFKRVDQYGYPQIAVREAVLNALVHREYSIPDSNLISIYDDRIEIVSLGGLPGGITSEDLLIPFSRCRNRSLADIFYRLKYIEQYGTGIPRIRASYKKSNQSPTLKSTGSAFQVILPNLNYNSGPLSVLPAVKNGSDLSNEEEMIIAACSSSSGLSRSEAESRFDLSRSKAGSILRRLVEEKKIIKRGSGKNTRYYKLPD